MADINEKERAAVFAEEDFVVELQVFLHKLMEEKGVSRAELARLMGVSRARVTQIFSDECKNFTVRLLARAFHALGETPAIQCKVESVSAEWEDVVKGMLVDYADLPLIWDVQRDFADIGKLVACNDQRPKRLNGYTYSQQEWEAA